MMHPNPLFLDYFKTKLPSAKADIDATAYAYIQQKLSIVNIGVRIYARYGQG